jgi:mannosyltransferase
MEAAWSTRERLAAWWALPTLIVACLTAVGIAVRVVMVQDSLFADELSTYWIVSTNGLGGVISTVHTDAEITPPLYFVLAWLSTRLDLTAELLRAPSFLAGAAAIPLTYRLGLRTVGRPAALVATAITALSPFMIFYSTEARGYELMVVLVMLSTLAMLSAVEDGRARWWIAYAACSSAAVYTHYTAVFALGAQLLWVLWAHPNARRAALLANVGAAVAFLPWLGGLIADLNSPTTKLLGELEPFNLNTIRASLEHWSIGYPFAFQNTALRELPGVVALGLLALGVGAALLGAGTRLTRGRWRPSQGRANRGVVLIIALALAAPVGEAVVSAFGNDVFGTRSLAVSWPAFAILLATLLVAARGPLRIVCVALVLAGFGIAAAKMTQARFQRPDYHAVAEFIDQHASRGDVVIDVAVLSPGPLTGLDAVLDQPPRIFRVGVPQERDHPFTVFDPVESAAKVTSRAAAAAHGRHIFVVTQRIPAGIPGRPTYQEQARAVTAALPRAYRQVRERSYTGILTLTVDAFARKHP